MRLESPGERATARDTSRPGRLLPSLILLALLLRLAAGLGLDHALGYRSDGSDAPWYLAHGLALVTGFDEGHLPGFLLDVNPDGQYINMKGIQPAPLYLIFIGIPQALFPRETAVLLVRIGQALLGAASVWLVWRLARAACGDERVGFCAAAALAISPAFILEATRVSTETLYVFLLLAALTLYSVRRDRVMLAGLLLGLATLTRAVLLLFPLGLVLHLLLVDGGRRGLQRALLLLLVYGLVVGSWTLYNLARWDRLVIAGEGLAAFLYIGALDGGWQGPAETDRQLIEDIGALPEDPAARQATYLQGAQQHVSADPAGHVVRRLRELAAALLQPHGTGHVDGPPLRNMVLDWLREGRSPPALQWATTEGFWPRLLIYFQHFVGLLAGLAGLWLTRSRWRQTLPPAAFIAYTLLLHFVLHAIPRYLFPTLPFWWVFAAATLVWLWQGMQARRA